MSEIKELMPNLMELHIVKVSDNTYLIRTDKGVVVTATNFGQVVKRAREFFDETITKGPKEVETAE